jgi:hypothetical protein
MGDALSGREDAMTSRNIIPRIEKLEARRRRPDELLLIWRRPGAAISKAVADARFAAGDRVICAEWFGENPMPAPRWFGKRLSSELGRAEYEYIMRSLNRLVEAEPARELGFSPVPVVPDNRMVGFTDNDLLHMVLGVET